MQQTFFVGCVSFFPPQKALKHKWRHQTNTVWPWTMPAGFHTGWRLFALLGVVVRAGGGTMLKRNLKDALNMPAVCSGSGCCAHCVWKLMLEVYPSFSCFINLLHGQHGRGPASPSLLWSLLCFAAVTAIARRRAKACWDGTEEIWWVRDARLGWRPNLGRSSQCCHHWLVVRCCVSPKMAAKLLGLPASHLAPCPLRRLCFLCTSLWLSLTWLSVHLCFSVCVCVRACRGGTLQTDRLSVRGANRQQKMRKMWEISAQTDKHRDIQTDRWAQTNRDRQTGRQLVTQIEQ